MRGVPFSSRRRAQAKSSNEKTFSLHSPPDGRVGASGTARWAVSVALRGRGVDWAVSKCSSRSATHKRMGPAQAACCVL